MPLEIKNFLHIVVILNIFLNVTFINSAVIRREPRSITTDNGTVSAISADKELEPATAIGLEDDGNLLLETLSTNAKDDTTTTKNSLQDSITTGIFGEENKRDTTLTDLKLDENTVSLSLDSDDQKPSKVVIGVENKNEPAKSKTHETTTEEIEEKSTITTSVKETTTISPVIEDTKITLKQKEEEKEKETSTVFFDTTTQFESSDSSKVKTEKEDNIGTTLENLVDTTTEIVAFSFEETTNVSAIDTTTKTNQTTATEVISTTNAVENDSTTIKITQSPATEKIDVKVTEPLSTQNGLIDTSTELIDDEVSKTFATNEQKANMTLEKEVTTESILLDTKNQNTDKQIQPEETTEFVSTSTEISEDEHSTVTMTVLQDYKMPTNDTKNSNSSSTEKRGKFIANNYSSFNDFHLPNTSDVWALAGLRSVGKTKSSELQNSVETSEEKPMNNSVVTKNLHDWTRVMETSHDIESKPSLKMVEIIEDSTTEITTNITPETDTNTTVKPEIDMSTEITTEMLIQQEALESKSNQDNEVELSTLKKVDSPTTVIAVTLIDEIETITNPTESQNVDNNFETTTDKYEKSDQITTEDSKDILSTTTATNFLHALNNHEKTIEENKVDGDSFEKEIISLPTTTTTVTPIPHIMTVKTETTDSLVNGEITQETNAGTTSLSTSSSLSDFSTSMPFLTTIDAITKATIVAMTDVQTTTPPVTFYTEYESNEPPSSTNASKIPTQSTSPVAVTMDSSAATTTTTTTPATTTTTTMTAVTATTPAKAITTETETETQTTEAPSHTPAIISNDTMMIQKSNNNNYNEYEVVSKSTENYTDDNSSTEAFEVTTRVGLHQFNWSTTIANIPITEVDKLNDNLDVTTLSNVEVNNNAYEINSTEATTTAIGTVTLAPKTYPIVTETSETDVTEPSSSSTTSTEHLDHIDPIHKISYTAETSIESNVIDPLQVGDTSTAATPTTTTTTTTKTTTESNQENMKMSPTDRGDDDYVYLISTTTTTTTTARTSSTPTTSTSNYDDSATTFESISTKKEDVYSIVPTIDNDGQGGGIFNVPKMVLDDKTTLMPPGELGIGGGGGGLQPMDSPEAQETDVNVIIAISVSTVGIIALILLVAFLYVMRKRQKQMSYGQRCRPVSLDAYSLDNVSVYNSVRRKGATLRASKRSYGNVAFDDPSLRHNVLGTHELARYVEKKSSIWEEFKEVPQIIARADEVPAGCEDKNRYANVIPLPETRVILQQQNGDEKSEYINANYVRGPKDTTNYYIACQAPLETTVNDFWRMIWEQNSRVIIMATDLIENGIDKCAEYLPPSVTLDNHTVFGDYQVTLKHREVKEKYAISTLMLKNTDGNEESREITHYWYQWPETGVPTDEAAIIAMLLEARSSLKASTIEQSDIKIENFTGDDDSSSAKIEINGNVASEKPKPPTKDQGPLTIHCSPGTGRTGTILACDIAMRCLEEPKRTVDIPQIVYSVRRGRASAVQTKEQYEFIYKVTHMYATKISNINNDN